MLPLILLATVGAWIGFANPVFQFPLAALAFPFGLAWIGLRANSLRTAFKFGWLAGFLAGIGLLYWVVIPVQFYGGLPWYIALPCPILLAAILAVYYGLFSSLMHFSGQRITGIPLCLLAGLTWSTMEIGMGTLFSGFPWLNLASAFSPWPYAIQGASIIGAYGLSGVFAALAVSVLLYWLQRRTLQFALVLLVGIVGFGGYQMHALPKTEPDYMLSLTQGNVDQAIKWEPKFQAATLKKYVKMSLEAIHQHHPKAIIWPETAMPFYLQDQTRLRKALEILAQETKTPIITGSPAYRVIDLKTRQYVLLNRAWLMDETGRTMQSYDKEHLVPFGEYMPFQEYIPFKKLVQAAGNFVPGTDNKPLMLDGVALGMLICYEGIFPEYAQAQIERGANALLNISNDAWFGNTSAPGQHLNLTILRAVEQGRWLVRCTNNGISAFVDPHGRLIAKSTQFQAENLSAKIAPRTEKTIFHGLYADILLFTPILTLLGFGCLLFQSKRNELQGTRR